MNLTAIIKKGEKQYVALCPELDVVSQGFTVEEALSNLKEAVALYLEDIGKSTAFPCIGKLCFPNEWVFQKPYKFYG